ncbi:LysE family transporter [Paenibacillus shunpengii]|uniref:LysE family transporter n=2 Tax=Paenibacillus TaxID=44249 RepID=A0ABW5SLI0_9BACL
MSFLIYVFVGSFTPGPNNILSMSNASRYGYKKTLPFSCGVMTGFFVVMLFCSCFNLLLFRFIPKIEFALAIIGSMYMIYLAIGIMRSKPQKKEEETKPYTFLTGVLLQFMNPKGILYGLTAVSTYILPHYNSSLSLILFSIFLAFISFLSTSSWAMFGSLFQRFLAKNERPFNVLMGLLLIYAAFSIHV